MQMVFLIPAWTRGHKLVLNFYFITLRYCYYQGKDSFGTYVNLHPRVANSIWMPDIFIDQVHPMIMLMLVVALWGTSQPTK